MEFLLLILITLFSLFHTIKSEPFSCLLVSGPAFFKLAVQWPNSFCNTDHSVLTSCKGRFPNDSQYGACGPLMVLGLCYRRKRWIIKGMSLSMNDPTIQNQIDAITEIKCNTDFHGRSQLQEVLFCASAQGVLLNCSYNTRNVYKSRNCPGNILFPSEPPALALPAPTLDISARLNFRALIIVSLYVFGVDEGGYTIYVTLTSLPK